MTNRFEQQQDFVRDSSTVHEGGHQSCDPVAMGYPTRWDPKVSYVDKYREGSGRREGGRTSGGAGGLSVCMCGRREGERMSGGAGGLSVCMCGRREGGGGAGWL